MRLARVLGGLTAGYGLATIFVPAVLAKPVQLTQPDGGTSWQVDALVRAVGARDAVSGIAMMVAPTGCPLQLALAVRVGSDAADAALFGSVAPTSSARKKAVAGAGGWALVNALALAQELRKHRG